jgi:hypothetical protein
MPSYSVEVRAEGPIFDNLATEAGHKFVRDATRKLADTGADWIRIAAMSMDISGRAGRGPHPHAHEAVLVYERDWGAYIFGGMVKGAVWWPWLEGVTERNQTTRFKGYHTFRKTAAQLNEHAIEIIQPEIGAYVSEMGGS